MRERIEVLICIALMSISCGLSIEPQARSEPSASGDATPSQHATFETWSCAKEFLESGNPPLRLSSDEILARVVRKTPIVPPAEGKFKSTVLLDIVVDDSGKPECLRGTKGHPLVVTTAITSVYEWSFKPLRHKKKARGFYGTVKLSVSGVD